MCDIFRNIHEGHFDDGHLSCNSKLCEITDLTQEGSKVVLRKFDTPPTGVDAIMSNQRSVLAISLDFDQKISFTLTKKGILKGISLSSDLIDAEIEEIEDPAAVFDATYFLFINTIRELISYLIDIIETNEETEDDE